MVIIVRLLASAGRTGLSIIEEKERKNKADLNACVPSAFYGIVYKLTSFLIPASAGWETGNYPSFCCSWSRSAIMAMNSLLVGLPFALETV